MDSEPRCRYRGAFGSPGQGVHAPRIFGLAAVDLVATAAASWLLLHAFGGSGLCAFMLVFLLLLAVAVGAHEAFCVNTRLNAALMGRDWPGPGAGAGPAPVDEKAAPPARRGPRAKRLA